MGYTWPEALNKNGGAISKLHPITKWIEKTEVNRNRNDFTKSVANKTNSKYLYKVLNKLTACKRQTLSSATFPKRSVFLDLHYRRVC